MKFEVGESVKWTSRIHNVNIKRRGEIVYIIDPFKSLSEVLESEDFIEKVGKKSNIIYNKLLEFRPCESYLVIAKKRDGQLPTLYWPDADILSRIRIRKSNKKVIKIKE